MSRVLLVGEAPSRAGTGLPLSGALERWARILHANPSEFWLLDRVNLLDRWPGSLGRGDAFPMGEARDAAALLRARWKSVGRCIFVGRRVAAAMGHADRPLEWVEDHVEPSLGLVAVVPHPSGVNREYNDPAFALRCARFVLEAARLCAPQEAPAQAGAREGARG